MAVTGPGQTAPANPVPPVLEPVPEKKGPDKLFAEAQEYREKHPDDFEGAIARFRTVRGQAKGTKWALAADDAIAEVQKARGEAIEAAFAPLKERAAGLAAVGDYDGALAVLDAPPPRFPGQLRPRLQTEREAVRKEAEGRFGPALRAAEEASKAGEPGKGLAELEKLSALKFASLAPRVAELRDRLEADRRDAAEQARKRLAAEAVRRRDAILDAFAAKLADGDVSGAAEGLSAGRKELDPAQLALVAPALDAAGRVAGELGKLAAGHAAALRKLVGQELTLATARSGVHRVTVTAADEKGLEVERWYTVGTERKRTQYRIEFAELAPGEVERVLPPPETRGADGQLALAVLALNGGDTAAAAKALDAAGAHPLAGRVRARLDTLVLGAVEAAAKGAWESEVRPLVHPRYDVAGAKGLLAALEGFEKAHGSTKFAAGIKPELGQLRSAAEAVIDASPEGLGNKVRQLFRGKVEKFDPRTLAVELSWDFSDPAQLEDFDLAGGKWKIENGSLVGEAAAAQGSGQAMLRAIIAPECRMVCSVTVLKDRGFYAGLGYGLESIGAYMSLVDYSGRPESRVNMRHIMYTGEHGRVNGDQQVPDLRIGAPASVEAAISGGRATCSLNGRLLGELKGLTLPAARPVLAFRSSGQGATMIAVTGLKVTGVLDRTWLEAAASLVGRPSPWQGAWTRMKARIPVTGHCAAAFDTKRGQYLAVSDDRTLTAYSLAADKTEVFYKPVPGDLPEFAVRFTDAGMVYDAGRDELVVGGNCGDNTLVFSLAERRWKACKGRIGPLPAMAAGGGRILALHSGGSPRDCRLSSWDADKGVWEDVACKMPPGRVYPGDAMTYDSVRKRFVMFSGSYMLNDTWAYDPDGKTWTDLRPAFSPPPRWASTIAYDPDNDLIAILGDRRRQDAWVYDARRNSWFEIASADRPKEYLTQLRYDAANKCFIARNSDYTSGAVWALRISPAGR